MESYAQVAIDFANALVSGDYEQAWAFLSESHREVLSEQQLQFEYEEMIEYGEGPILFAEVMETLTNWPAKQQGDVGWVYVAIVGSEYSEAVAVIVCKEGAYMRIREIEWGRP